ncbi:MAG TPA: hypothetical protein VK783_05570 [Bacteroidia bacterium]|jgi:hypothetical protein|nr:hypothetical protein [Bacteroidia bacterium]
MMVRIFTSAIISIGAIFLVNIFSSCNIEKTESLTNGMLIGCYGVEIVKSDTSVILFNTDSTYTRKGEMYIRKQGSYIIRNDTLFINYCDDGKNQQGYVLTKKRNLRLVYLSDNDGSSRDINQSSFDKEIKMEWIKNHKNQN